MGLPILFAFELCIFADASNLGDTKIERLVTITTINIGLFGIIGLLSFDSSNVNNKIRYNIVTEQRSKCRPAEIQIHRVSCESHSA